MDIIDEAMSIPLEEPALLEANEFFLRSPHPWPIEVSRHVEWLLTGPIRRSDGMPAAWVDGHGRPAYAYPEAAGYALTLMGFLHDVSGNPRFVSEARRWAEALLSRSEPGRPIGREGVGYLFDTAMVIRGLCAFESMANFGEGDLLARRCREWKRGLTDLAVRWIGERRAQSGADVHRWSGRFTWHMLKAMQHVADKAGEDAARELCLERSTELMSSLDTALVRGQTSRSEPTYLHAYAYGLEGLAAWRNSPPADAAAVVERGVKRLSEIQRADGGIPRWWPGDADAAVDATAQAVRLWQCADRRAYRERIEMGLRFLKACSDPRGGVLYSPNSDHRNAWTTMFAIQAMIWRQCEPEPAWIL